MEEKESNKEVGKYFTVHQFMIKELKLKNNQLMIYALIYGFSRNGDGCWHGSLDSLTDYVGITVQGAIKVLKALESKGLINKKVIYKDNVKRCEYTANFRPKKVLNKVEKGTKQSLEGYSTKFRGGTKQSLGNNISYIETNKEDEEEKSENSSSTSGLNLMLKDKHGNTLAEIICSTMGNDYLEQIISKKKTIDTFFKTVEARGLKSFLDWTNYVAKNDLEMEHLQNQLKVKHDRIRKDLKDFYAYHKGQSKLYTKKDFRSHFINWKRKQQK